jgi:hypothetical protein
MSSREGLYSEQLVDGDGTALTDNATLEIIIQLLGVGAKPSERTS